MRVWINGLGWVTPAGQGQGRQSKEMPLRRGDLEIPTRKQVFAQIDRRFGRLDDFSRRREKRAHPVSDAQVANAADLIP